MKKCQEFLPLKIYVILYLFTSCNAIKSIISKICYVKKLLKIFIFD